MPYLLKHNTMKRSFLFLGLSLALGFAITSTVRASGKFLKVCCGDNNVACRQFGDVIVDYGPEVYDVRDCW